MNVESIMHVAFNTDQMDELITFYTKKMGFRLKTVVRYGIYLDRDDRPAFQAIAKEDPDRIFNAYIEVCDRQFLELFPKTPGQGEHIGFNTNLGYSHFALVVDDIHETRKELEERGVVFDTNISKGPSETYQMWLHDPDGNKFEIMQFTENSIQLKGNI